MFCPNLSNKQVASDFNELKSLVGENKAYYYWNKHEGEYSSIMEELQKIQQSKRKKHFTTQEWTLSNRLSSLLSELFPDISVDFVDSIQGGYVGEADLNALKILVDTSLEKIDTIPHEYAHFYVAMFRDTDLVKDGIEAYGSEEALVQALGERTVEKEGKARSWWQKLFDKVKLMLNKNKLYKEMLLAELSDAFLINREIGQRQEVSGIKHQSISDIRTILSKVASSIVYDDATHTYTDRDTGKVLKATSKFKEDFHYSNYDVDEDEMQSEISNEARTNGNSIHSLFEALFTDNFERNSFSQFTDSAIEDVKKIVDKFKERYNFIASEAKLSDVEHGVAGTADLLMRDKSDNKNVLFDFKSKMYKYNGKDTNKKGRKLWGFTFALRSNFSTRTLRDGYDFQLSVYERMLDKLGIKVKKRAVIPIVFSVNGGKISSVYISKIFGKDKESNQKLEQDGYFEISKSKQVQYDVDYKMFDDSSQFEGDIKRTEEMINSTKEIINKIVKRLEIQKELFRLKNRRTQQYEASKLYERIQNLSELDALLHYVNYAAEQLFRLNEQIERLYKENNDSKWDLSILQYYREVASSYKLVGDIPGLVHRFQDLFDKKDIETIDRACNKFQQYQRNILSACDQIGSKLYLDEITPRIGNIEYEMWLKERAKYVKENPKKSDETKEEFDNRIEQHRSTWQELNQEEIQYRTREFLRAQSEIANNGFECSSLFANLNSVYESKDPFVQAAVMMFDEKMNERDRILIQFRAKLQRALNNYRKKYPIGNFSNLQEVFKDFIEITENGTPYLVNQTSGQYIEAEIKARDEIFNDSNLTYKEKQTKFRRWLDENNPISDTEAYELEFKRLLDTIIVDVSDEQKKVIEDNLKLNPIDRKPWREIYGQKKITSELKESLEDLEYTLDIKYRRPNKRLYKNDKYDAMMALPKDDPKRALWELLYDTASQNDVSVKTLRLNYRLPAIMKRGAELVSSKGVTKVAIDKVKRGFVVMKDNDTRGTFVNEEGKRLNTVPMYFYRDDLTLDEQSFDLPTIYAKWLDAALTYTVKKEIEDVMLQTQAVLHSRATYDKTYSILSGKKKEKTSSHKENTQKLFDEWLQQVFYNDTEEDLGSISIPFLDKEIDISKTLQTVISRASRRLMSFNAIAGINNALNGEIQQLEEVFAGEFTSKEAYMRASKIFFANIKGMIEDVTKAVPENDVNKFAQYFGLFEADQNMLLTGIMRHSISDIEYSPNKAGEKEMQLRFALSMLINTKARDENGKVLGSMYDYVHFDENNMLVVDPKVANFGTDEQNKFSLKVRRVILGMHGNYSSRSSVAAQRYWYGKMGLTLRRWITSTIFRRYAGRHYSNLTQSEIEGFHSSSVKWVLFQNPVMSSVASFVGHNIFRAKDLQIQAMKWDELDEVTKRNIIRFTVEMVAIASTYLLFCLLGNIDDDDDDYAIVSNLRYQMYRLNTDLSFYFLPTSFTKILQDPFPVISYLNEVIDTFMQIFNISEEYQTGNHLFDNKFLNKSSRLIPGVKQIGRWSNVAEEMELFVRR